MRKLASFFILLLSSSGAAAPLEIHQAFNCSTFLTRIKFANSTPEEPLEILTPRLILRRGTDSDYPAISRIFSDVETTHNLFGKWQAWTSRESMYKLRELMRGIQPAPPEDRYIRVWDFVIALRENNQMIGAGSISQFPNHHWQSSAAIDPRYRNQGFSTERLVAVIQFVRQLDPQARFKADVLKTNLESQHVLEKLGFKRAKVDKRFDYFTYWLEPKSSR